MKKMFKTCKFIVMKKLFEEILNYFSKIYNLIGIDDSRINNTSKTLIHLSAKRELSSTPDIEDEE